LRGISQSAGFSPTPQIVKAVTHLRIAEGNTAQALPIEKSGL
jgi:hypothetical protein